MSQCVLFFPSTGHRIDILMRNLLCRQRETAQPLSASFEASTSARELRISQPSSSSPSQLRLELEAAQWEVLELRVQLDFAQQVIEAQAAELAAVRHASAGIVLRASAAAKTVPEFSAPLRCCSAPRLSLQTSYRSVAQDNGLSSASSWARPDRKYSRAEIQVKLDCSHRG